MADKSIRDLVVLKSLTVGPPQISRDSARAAYTIIKQNGEKVSNELIYTFDEHVFNPEDPFSQNLASVMLSQVALNYGLFFENIVFDGLFDKADRRFLIDMMENTSREIFVNKLLKPNKFLLESAHGIKAEVREKYTASKVIFANSAFIQPELNIFRHDSDQNVHVVLSSGGKDSLLSYGLLKELGKNVHPVFINESGRHWFTALNTYRYLKNKDKRTGKVWCNCDRIYNWMLRQMPFIRPDFNNLRADDYPIRLWTVAVFIFGVLPLAFKQKAGRILIGNEYDTSVRSKYHGITHYNMLYDQSRWFDRALSRYYRKKGWNISQFSILRSLSELLIMKVLVKRYPELQEQQVSCHAAHEEDGRLFPCGNCEKCRRIVGMLSALDEDPHRCGYNDAQISKCLKKIQVRKIKQIGSDSSHLYYLLLSKGLIERNERTEKMAIPHPEIVNLRYDNQRSKIDDIPEDLQVPLKEIFLQYAEGSVRFEKRKWVEC